MIVFARRALVAVLSLFGVFALVWAGAAPASAHGFSSVVYADVSSAGPGHARVELQLEYDLLVVSVADAEKEDALYQEGTAAFRSGTDDERAAALQAHTAAIERYLAPRFTVSADRADCTSQLTDDIRMTQQNDVPYAVVTLDYTCRPAEAHVVTSTLFPDGEGYVKGTTTILTYDIDIHSGSTVLDVEHPSFSTQQSTLERFWEFFRLGAEHLLTGIDHILFLVALIAGSRRLREIVIAATTFTIAHSVTFILAATGLVSAPSFLVEPTIAFSIAIVGAWHLWRLWREGKAADVLTRTSGPLGLDRAGWIRVGVVFAFGLVHGLGFASALGIDEPWSWTLLWSLLVFNVGIEAVQIGIIILVFPVLALLRRKWPRVGLWATGLLAAVVTVTGLVWFVQRVLGIE